METLIFSHYQILPVRINRKSAQACAQSHSCPSCRDEGETDAREATALQQAQIVGGGAVRGVPGAARSGWWSDRVGRVAGECLFLPAALRDERGWGRQVSAQWQCSGSVPVRSRAILLTRCVRARVSRRGAGWDLDASSTCATRSSLIWIVGC